MAKHYVNPIRGSDTDGDGTKVAPYKTINKALSVAATASPMGDTIILAPGVYRELVVIPVGKNPLFIGQGLCYIDGEGIRDCVEVTYDTTRANVKSYWENVKFRNPLTSIIKAQSGLASTIFIGDMQFFNCDFYNDTSGAGTIVSITNCYNQWIELHHCTIKRLIRFGNYTTMPPANNVGYLIADTVGDVTDTNTSTNIKNVTGTALSDTNLAVTRSAWTGGAASSINLTTTAYPYTDATFPDPNLAPNYAGANIASFRAAGYKGANIGSSWFPQFGHIFDRFRSLINGFGRLTAWYDPVSEQSFITDPNYTGAGKTEAVRINDENGDHWEINTQLDPAATSAAFVSPVYEVSVDTGITAKIRHAIWQSDEDTSPASGSKKVVDSSAGTSTRHIQYRASTTEFDQDDNAVAWTDIAKDSDLSVSFTSTFYIQTRTIMTIVGT